MSVTSDYALRQMKCKALAMLALSLTLPFAVVGNVSQAAPLTQTETPTPIPSSTPTKPILLTDPVPDPHQEGVTYFPETGHTLRGKFLAYWQQNGGLAQFGYPLTEEFFEPDGPNNSPLQVQYFERNRFEMHPENQPPYDVLLGTLGREFRQQDSPAAPEPAPAFYFPETSHNLGGEFLKYWQAHGGLAVNGYPITEPAMETSTNGKQYLTQWFERSRFELHPENAGSPYEVLLGVLGRQLSEKRGYPYGWYPPYGRAVDYSWLAGQFISPLIPEQCPTIKYVQIKSSPVTAISGTRVQPTGAIWDRGIRGFGSTALVVFGSMDEDPNKDTQGNTCDAPEYAVGKLQHNPAR